MQAKAKAQRGMFFVFNLAGFLLLVHFITEGLRSSLLVIISKVLMLLNHDILLLLTLLRPSIFPFCIACLIQVFYPQRIFLRFLAKFAVVRSFQ